jgi:DNA primase
MKDTVKVKELILQTVDLSAVLLQYKVQFVFDPTKASEAQMHCPFHGTDRKPSARYYRATQSIFCWKCHKSWDVISFIMEKEGFNFGEALRYIVSRFNIDVSLIPDDPEMKEEKTRVSEASVKFLSVESSLHDLRGKLQFERFRALCTALTMARYAETCGESIEATVAKIEEKLHKVEQEA